MSGLEVAGLVLGILPIAVKALHSYRSILSSVKNLNHDILALVQDIETEGVRLRTNCELLLDDIVPFHKIDTLLEDPLSPAWKEFDVDYKLRMRLYDSYPKFEEKIRDIQQASSVLKQRLGIEEDSKIPYTDKKSISRALKKTSFALNRKDYEDIISRMKSANTFLNSLAVNCKTLDTSRKRRSQNRVIQLLHSLTKSLFKALQNAATGCHCPKPHDAYLELVARKLVLVPHVDSEDQVAKDVDFHIVLASVKNSRAVADHSLELGLQQRWTSFRLQCGSSSPLPLPPALPMADSGVPLSTSSSMSPMTLIQRTENMNRTQALGTKTSTKITTSSRWSRTASSFTSLLTGQSKKKVAFAPVSSTQTLITDSPSTLTSLPLVGPTHTTTAPAAIKPKPLLNVCQVTLSNEKSQVSDKGYSYGYIMDSSEGRRFELQPLQWDGQIQPQTHQTTSEFRTSLTLRQILESNARYSGKGLPGLDVHTKLSMAYSISANILHLHSTPWLSRIVTLDDIVFLIDRGSTFKLRPFVTKPLAQKSKKQADASVLSPMNSTEPESSMSAHRPMDLSSFSFGLLLIQLITGRVDNAIDLAAASHSAQPQVQRENPSLFASQGEHQPTSTSQGGDQALKLSKILDLHQHAGEFQDELCQYAGANVVDVVNWCRQSYKDLRGLENEEFRQGFQYEVVEKLEKDLKNVPAPQEGKGGMQIHVA